MQIIDAISLDLQFIEIVKNTDEFQIATIKHFLANHFWLINHVVVQNPILESWCPNWLSRFSIHDVCFLNYQGY